MHVRDLPIPGEIRDHLVARGVGELYPPQSAAVRAGVCDGEGLLAAVPTAGGKTLIAKLALLTADGPGLYIVPLRALAREKHAEFDALPGVNVGISTGDYDSAADLAAHDVVVATSEKVDAAIRHGADWVSELACVVVDEVHLLGAAERGPTLEVTLATLQRLAPGLQVVALSATVPNAGEVAGWLDAELVESEWRPVPLRTGVYADGAVAFDDGGELVVGDGQPEDGEDAEAATDATASLVADAVADGGQALAFVRSRREAEDLADRLTEEGFDAAPEAAESITTVDDTDAGRRLGDCARDGVAFHHAGLRSGHREAVEAAFRARDLAAIAATPTLAAGVNVPARRVVVRDQRRFTGSGMEWLPVLEVRQMCGRAGRPHLDPYGEAVLVGEADSRAELESRYVGTEPDAVESNLGAPAALRTHVLSAVAAEFAESESALLELFGATFYAHQSADRSLGADFERVIGDLGSMGMLERSPGGELEATELGAQVSRQYVTPETGARIVEGLRAADRMDEVTDLTALEMVCDTPDMDDTYLGNRERAAVYRFARAHAAEFTTAMDDHDDFEGWLTAIKTVRVLAERADGASDEELVDRHRIGPGDLESRVERATWLLGAAAAVASVVGVECPALGAVRDRL